MTRLIYLFCFFLIGTAVNAQQINWSSFMQNQTMKWDSIGNNYYSGAILGNGLLGLNIYKPIGKIVRFDVGRSDVVDNRAALYPKVSELYTKPRLPIGYFALTLKGQLKSSVLELDLHKAKVIGKLITDLGNIEFTAYVAATKDVIVIDLTVNGQEKDPELHFIADESISPRLLQSHPKDKPKDFEPNPAVQHQTIDGFTIYHQNLLNGGGYATVYKTLSFNQHLKTIISIGYDAANNKDEVAEAKQNIINMENDKDNLNEHEKWWNNYYPKSFVALPDKRMETFYWTQLYKLSSLTRSQKPMIDLMGPWTNPTPWPAIWWNLNTQLTYSPLFTANHIDLGDPLFNALNNNLNNLITNVPAEWQYNSAAIGRSSSYDLVSKITKEEINNGNFESSNLVWTLYYYHQYYLYTGDQETLKTKIFPLLKRATNFLIHLLAKDEKGIYHLQISHSPEYKNAVDANYGLSSLRWALNTLIETDRQLKLKDKERKNWEYILQNLTNYPQNETGFMIGKDVALETSHRHYSHLLMIYPYHLINWDQVENRNIIEKSLQHWLSLKGALQGYTFTGAASIYATMGKGNQAYAMLNQLFDTYIQPNTLYKESGPVIETPLSAVTSIQEMLLQSWGGKIRVFPAIPSTWENAAFDQLLTAGAFEVSAKLVHKKTTYIKVKSKIGGQCKLQTSLQPLYVQTNLGKPIPFKSTTIEGGNQLITFHTQPGDIIEVLSSKNTDKLILPVAYQHYKNWHWGINKNKITE